MKGMIIALLLAACCAAVPVSFSTKGIGFLGSQNFMIVRSPFDGKILRTGSYLKKFVSKEELLFRLAPLDDIPDFEEERRSASDGSRFASQELSSLGISANAPSSELAESQHDLLLHEAELSVVHSVAKGITTANGLVEIQAPFDAKLQVFEPFGARQLYVHKGTALCSLSSSGARKVVALFPIVQKDKIFEADEFKVYPVGMLPTKQLRVTARKKHALLYGENLRLALTESRAESDPDIKEILKQISRQELFGVELHIESAHNDAWLGIDGLRVRVVCDSRRQALGSILSKQASEFFSYLKNYYAN